MLKKLNAFIAVADTSGFAKAAKKTGNSTATVTRYIQELEAEYHTVFFLRTTRHVSLTEAGETFYDYALDMIQLHDDTQTTLGQLQEKVAGHVKIGLPISIMQRFVQEKIPELTARYPDLVIEIIHGNHINDLLSSHFDVVLHCGPLPDVNFYYEKIATWQKVLCASPAYLAEHGKPKKLADLAKHICLDHADNHTLCWALHDNGKPISHPINSTLRINSCLALKTLAMEGQGIVYLPSFAINDALANQTLIPILKTTWSPSLNMYALYPQRKRTHKKTTVIIEALRDLFAKV